jgi:hypothetical protein
LIPFIDDGEIVIFKQFSFISDQCDGAGIPLLVVASVLVMARFASLKETLFFSHDCFFTQKCSE